MSDLIKREDAIDAICKEWCYVTYGNCPHVDDGFVCDGCDDVKVLSALPSADAEWIPCSERLPSESGWYLITVQGCEKVADMEWYYSEWDAWNGVSSEQQVIAWMPLPKPYKGGDSE